MNKSLAERKAVRGKRKTPGAASMSCNFRFFKAWAKAGTELGFPRTLPHAILAAVFFMATLPSIAQIPYLPGWPANVNQYSTSSLVLADIDDDGFKEVLFNTMPLGAPGNYAGIFLKSFDGQDMSGWPKQYDWCGKEVVASDLNDDGGMEIVSGCFGLKAFDAQGNLLWEIPYDGPIFQSTYFAGGLSIEDIDGNGAKEIIMPSAWGGAVFVFDAQGSVRPGWPVLIPPVQVGWDPPPIHMSASIGDTDQDGLEEIIFGTGQGQLYCLKPDGAVCPGFPIMPSGVVAGYGYKPILYDLDGNGFKEILIADTPTFTFRVYDHLANVLQAIVLTAMPLSFGDPDGDGVMDVGFKAQGGYHLFETAGFEEHPNYPVDFTGGPHDGWHVSNCAFADLNGDRAQELLSGSACCGFVSDGRMFALDMNGAIIPNFPTEILYHRGTAYRYPTIADVDGNGTLDFCTGSTNDESVVPRSSTVYCWDTGHPYNLDNVDWAMDGFDLGHTGRWRRLYHLSKSGSQLTVDGCGPESPCYLPPDGSLIPVIVTAVRENGGANPSGQDVRYSRTLGCANYEGPVIDNGDGTYIRMLRAPTADCTTDIHAWVNEFKLADYQTIIFRIPNPKEASPTASPMTAEKEAGTSVVVHYTAGCGATTHAVYWGSGPISSGLTWTDAACDVTSGGTFDPGPLDAGEWIYFVVVSQNSTLEGSYGRDSLDQERPEAVGIGACDKPQDLTGTCP
jgi:hypothetical protein